jgi:hypothetical protein
MREEEEIVIGKKYNVSLKVKVKGKVLPMLN